MSSIFELTIPKQRENQMWSPSILANINGQSNSTSSEPDSYTKAETDVLLASKANIVDVYSKTETDTLLATKANTTTVNSQLALKADNTNVYTKTEVNNLLEDKANTDDVYIKSETYNKNEINTLISNSTLTNVFVLRQQSSYSQSFSGTAVFAGYSGIYDIGINLPSVSMESTDFYVQYIVSGKITFWTTDTNSNYILDSLKTLFLESNDVDKVIIPLIFMYYNTHVDGSRRHFDFHIKALELDVKSPTIFRLHIGTTVVFKTPYPNYDFEGNITINRSWVGLNNKTV